MSIPTRADPDRLGLIGASFTSLDAYRLLLLTDHVALPLVLVGMVDGSRFRHALEMGAPHTRPPLGQALMAPGFPNSSPELPFRHSNFVHLEGLPPSATPPGGGPRPAG